jgi:protein-S-isoprenylcysteine O-methyltransferase Ste14
MALLVKNLLFTLIVPGTVAGLVPMLIVRGRSAALGPTTAPALLLFVAGGAIYAWCVWDFASFGRGTPAPIDAPKKLVVRGLYRFTRNPMYVGVLTVILGWVVLFRSWPLIIYLLSVGTMFQLFIVLYEERHLRREFGGEYDDYRARVPRWLFGRRS